MVDPWRAVVELIRDTIGKADILIASIDEGTSDQNSGRITSPTAAKRAPSSPQDSSLPSGACEKARQVVAELISSFESAIPAVEDRRLKSVGLEFQMSYSARADVWILNAGGEHSWKVMIGWRFGPED